MAKSKFYAFKGEENKIFTSWNECSDFMTGKKGYTYKSFSSLSEAEAYLNGVDYYDDLIKKDLNSGYAVAYTDGSYEETINGYSYGVIAIALNGEEERYSGFGQDKEFLSSRNVAGEAIGAITAIKWAYLNGFDKLKIYHDYAGLAFWADRTWAAKSPISSWYISELKRYLSVVKVEFVKVKGHSNDKYNEEVDKLAKNALLYGEYLPLKISKGFKADGDIYGEFLEKFNREAGKCEISYRGDGVGFKRGDDFVFAFKTNGYTLVSGNFGFLYSLAASVACKFYRGNARKIGLILSEAFDADVYFSDNDKNVGFNAAKRIAEKTVTDNYAPLCIFALHEIEFKIKALLSLGKNDRISDCFYSDGEIFKLKSGFEKSRKAEELYNYFYNNRTRFYSLYMTKERFDEFIESVEAMGE